MTLSVTGDAEADELVRSNPLALLIAMLLDQQISIELAFRGPHRLAQRLGELSVNRIVSTELDDLIAAFSQKPACTDFRNRWQLARMRCVHTSTIGGQGGLKACGPTRPMPANSLGVCSSFPALVRKRR